MEAEDKDAKSCPECVDCLTIQQLQVRRPVSVAYSLFANALLIIFVVGLFRFMWLPPTERDITSLVTIGTVASTGWLVWLCVFLSRNVWGQAVWLCQDTGGRVHIHATDPLINSILMDKDENLWVLGKDMHGLPFLCQPSSPRFFMPLGGWILPISSIHNGWIVQKSWAGQFTVKDRWDIEITCALFNFKQCKDVLDFMNNYPEIGNAVYQAKKVGEAQQESLLFLIEKLEGSKNRPGLGKSSHAHLLRLCLESIRERLGENLFVINRSDARKTILEQIWKNNASKVGIPLPELSSATPQANNQEATVEIES